MIASIQILLISTLLLIVPLVKASVFPLNNGESLKGVKAFDASFIFGTEDQRLLDRFGREALTTGATNQFILGLRRDGVVVDSSAPNFLICTLSAVTSTSGDNVAYSVNVKYWDWSESGLNTLLWENGYIVAVGLSNFDINDVVQDCNDMFAGEWLKWNPK